MALRRQEPDREPLQRQILTEGLLLFFFLTKNKEYAKVAP